MDQANPDKKTSQKRQRLTPERITDAAMALIDEVGLDAFSFRTLARKLGCQAMSIYHYFPSKAHLFEALVDVCLAEIELPPPGATWQDRLRNIAWEIRGVALRHPGFFLYFSIFRMNNRAGMTLLNAAIGILEEVTPDPALRARQFRAFSYYVMGAGLDEAMGYAHGPSAVDPVADDAAAQDFPAVVAVGPYFADEHHDAIFEFGVEALLRGIAAEAG